MTETLIDLVDSKESLSPEQQQLFHVMQGHIVLQDQFNQLTKHCEAIYERLTKLEKLMQSKVLS